MPQTGLPLCQSGTRQAPRPRAPHQLSRIRMKSTRDACPRTARMDSALHSVTTRAPRGGWLASSAGAIRWTCCPVDVSASGQSVGRVSGGQRARHAPAQSQRRPNHPSAHSKRCRWHWRDTPGRRCTGTRSCDHPNGGRLGSSQAKNKPQPAAPLRARRTPFAKRRTPQGGGLLLAAPTLCCAGRLSAPIGLWVRLKRSTSPAAPASDATNPATAG